jgi:hypothetical protein
MEAVSGWTLTIVTDLSEQVTLIGTRWTPSARPFQSAVARKLLGVRLDQLELKALMTTWTLSAEFFVTVKPLGAFNTSMEIG